MPPAILMDITCNNGSIKNVLVYSMDMVENFDHTT